MPLPDVKIVLGNGQLGGLLNLADGVCAMIGTGVAVSGKIGIGEPRLVFSLDDAEDIGLNEEDNPVAHRHLKEFYSQAPVGSELYVMLVADTMTQSSMLDITNANGAKKLLDFAQGRVRMLFSFFEPNESFTPNYEDGVEADVITAITKGQALAESYALSQAPLRVIVEGRKFSGVIADLADLTQRTDNRVLVVVGSTLDDGSASVGLFAGRCAANPVQRKASRVKDGALGIQAAYIHAAKVEDIGGLAVIHDKGYVVLRTFPGVAGYFFSGDQMATGTTDDYRFMSRGRVIDKAQIIAYLTFVEELDDEVAIDENGRISAGVLRYLEQKIENQINQIMTANREISSVTAFIDPNQDILASNELVVELGIVPVGYNTSIKVRLGFRNPNFNQ